MQRLSVLYPQFTKLHNRKIDINVLSSPFNFYILSTLGLIIFLSYSYHTIFRNKMRRPSLNPLQERS